MRSFSGRLPNRLTPNRWSAALARVGTPSYDLTLSNPTQCALPYPDDLLTPLADSRGLEYDPDPRGHEPARRAIAGTYRTYGTTVPADHVVLTASTSEAYSLLFRLLCDSGDAVLIPAPSYPLFDHLARIDGVGTVPYRLAHDDDWRLDPDAFASAPANTRAVIVVHPNNPTGSYLHPEDRDRIVARCTENGWALIADEVFFDYNHLPSPGSDRSFTDCSACLTFSLGGLSKSIGMPQLKLSWMVINGPAEDVTEAVGRIEYLNDAYLSVCNPVARSVETLLERGAHIRHSITERCRANLRTVERQCLTEPTSTHLPTSGGWSTVLRIPAVLDEEAFVVRLLESQGVAVHPGFFYDFPRDGFVVLSLLPREDLMQEGMARLVTELQRVLAEI